MADCHKHFLCTKCAKNYFENIIERGEREIVCPFMKCKQPVDLKFLKNFISEKHFNLLYNNNSVETNNIKEKEDLYEGKHIIEINTNQNFYEYNIIRKAYCPNCFMKSLYLKTNALFYYICLNCENKICKFCMKKFTVNHMDTSNKDHCKVYYRIYEEKKNISLLYLLFLQLFFVFASFYLCSVATFLFFRKIFFSLFRINNKSNIIFYIFAYFFAIILFLITLPFILLLYPYFPTLMALTDS